MTTALFCGSNQSWGRDHRAHPSCAQDSQVQLRPTSRSCVYLSVPSASCVLCKLEGVAASPGTVPMRGLLEELGRWPAFLWKRFHGARISILKQPRKNQDNRLSAEHGPPRIRTSLGRDAGDAGGRSAALTLAAHGSGTPPCSSVRCKKGFALQPSDPLSFQAAN